MDSPQNVPWKRRIAFEHDDYESDEVFQTTTINCDATTERCGEVLLLRLLCRNVSLVGPCSVVCIVAELKRSYSDD